MEKALRGGNGCQATIVNVGTERIRNEYFYLIQILFLDKSRLEFLYKYYFLDNRCLDRLKHGNFFSHILYKICTQHTQIEKYEGIA
jgi:hypothetical protein